MNNTTILFVIIKNVVAIAVGAYFAALAFAAISNVVLAVLAAIAVYFVAETLTSVAIAGSTFAVIKLAPKVSSFFGKFKKDAAPVATTTWEVC